MTRLTPLKTEGFTLLETLIAMSIMLITFASILVVQSSSLNSSAKAKQMNIVGMLAKNAMAQTEVEMTGKKFDELPEESSETFSAPYEDYTWIRTVKEVEFPDLSSLISSGQDDASSQQEQEGGTQIIDQMSKLMTQFISKAIREVTITIQWEKSGKKQNYTVATYWVDLNSDFQLSF